MIKLKDDVLYARSELLANVRKCMTYLTEANLYDDDRRNAIIRTLACALDEHEEYIKGALSGRFEVEA